MLGSPGTPRIININVGPARKWVTTGASSQAGQHLWPVVELILMMIVHSAVAQSRPAVVLILRLEVERCEPELIEWYQDMSVRAPTWRGWRERLWPWHWSLDTVGNQCSEVSQRIVSPPLLFMWNRRYQCLWSGINVQHNVTPGKDIIKYCYFVFIIQIKTQASPITSVSVSPGNLQDSTG